jgi:hypothetical protein
VRAGFGVHIGRPVAFEALTPSAFRTIVATTIGDGPAAGVAAFYELPGNTIPAERSAEALLGLKPRTTGQWLADIGL